jgi:hypothetical protein
MPLFYYFISPEHSFVKIICILSKHTTYLIRTMHQQSIRKQKTKNKFVPNESWNEIEVYLEGLKAGELEINSVPRFGMLVLVV